MSNIVIIISLSVYYMLVQLKLTRIEEKIDKLNHTNNNKG